jgi:hypothetical protein
MQTCSNCGATSREGAKFCTTCGSRLNPVVEDTGSNGWNAFPSTDETQISTAAVDTSDTETAPDEREETAGSTPPASWSWGQSTTTSDEPATTDEADTTTPNDELSSWASQWNTTPPSDEPDAEDDDDDSVAGIEAASAELQSAELTEVSQFAPASKPDEVIAEEEEVEAATEEQVASTTEVQDEPSALFDTAPSPEAAIGDAPGPQERARVLLHELRELIDESFVAPAVAATTGAGDSGSALATLNALGDDGDRFDSLRAMLEKAREQPRDVDTMLNLLGEINSLIALVDRHHDYVTAVNTAKQQLSGGE